MSVLAGFGGVRCRTNSVGVKWRDGGGVFFFGGKQQGNGS